MQKLFSIIFLAAFLLSLPYPSLAFDRNSLVQGARVVSNSNFVYNTNVANIILNSGPTFVGSTNKSLPAYQQISNIISQIELLKKQLKSRN